MNAKEVLRLRSTNNELMKRNQKLVEMMKVLEKFRAMFISMVNNCKCNTESNIRSKFNLLMEEYYDIKDNKVFDNNNEIISKDFKNRNTFNKCGKSGVKKVYSFKDDHKIDDNIDKSNDSIATDPEFDQIEDNINSEKQHKKAIDDDNEDIDERPKPSAVIPKTPEEIELDLRERIAIMKRFVAKPKKLDPNREPQKFPCLWPGCEAVFKRKAHMKKHMSIHTGEKPLTCDWPGCDFRTAFCRALKIHKLRHTGEKPWKCSWPDCEWTFRSSDHLKVHMLKHTGERPFSCEFVGCDRRFTSRQAMRYHLERAHKI